MPCDEYDCGAMPGTSKPPLTKDPIGTSGELSPGPDHLRPEVPEERDELVRMGYLPEREESPQTLADMGIMDDGFKPVLPEW